MKKKYTYPKMIMSASKEDLEIAKVLRDKYYINISSFFRNKIRELYKSLNENNKNI